RVRAVVTRLELRRLSAQVQTPPREVHPPSGLGRGDQRVEVVGVLPRDASRVLLLAHPLDQGGMVLPLVQRRQVEARLLTLCWVGATAQTVTRTHNPA